MNANTVIHEAIDEVPTIAAIGSITYLGLHGVTDTFIVGAVAGLGGYAVLKRREAAATADE
jgi:hypothetical protein